MIELPRAEPELIVMLLKARDVLHPVVSCHGKYSLMPGKPSCHPNGVFPLSQVFVGVPGVALLLVSTMSIQRSDVSGYCKGLML